jgi:iron complex outermembrane receptor protein
MKNYLCILACLIAQQLYSQTGQLKGTVTSSEGDTVAFATVIIMVGDSMIDGTQADPNGNYRISKIKPGTYNIKFSHVGLEPQIANGIIISNNNITHLNAILNGPLELKETIVEEKAVERKHKRHVKKNNE